MTAPETAGQAAEDPIPEVFVRWLSTSYATGHVPTAHDITSEWKRLSPARREFWRELAAMGAAAPAPQAVPAVTVRALAAALALRKITVRVGNGYERRTPVYPDALAAELLAAIDLRLTENPEPQPQAAPGLAAATPPLGTAWRLLDETRAERDDYAARLKATDQSWAKLAAERDGLKELLHRFERITTAWSRGMYMARIDCMRGDVSAAIDTLCEGLDGYDGTEWNGTETGAEWWERTKAEEGL